MCGRAQLSGMAERSTISGVVIWRPALAHEKDVIFDFAHKYGVPCVDLAASVCLVVNVVVVLVVVGAQLFQRHDAQVVDARQDAQPAAAAARRDVWRRPPRESESIGPRERPVARARV